MPTLHSSSSSSSSVSLYGGKTFSQLLAEVKANVAKAAASGPKKPQSCRNGIVQARVHGERDRFIASIQDDHACNLASIHHNGDSCVIFKPFVRGSYNICYFVEFANGDKWVVRVPLAPTLGLDPADKLESEIAAMRLVAARTTIPIPKIHAFALGDGPAPFASFLILEYVHGQKINYPEFKALADEQRDRLYTSLADIYLQLRRLEFPFIGRLVQGPDGVRVGKRVFTLDTNLQELEEVAPSEVMDPYYGGSGALIRSADQYVEMLLDLADNAFRKSRGIASNEEEAEDRLYHLHLFRQHAEEWVDHSLDKGPFVLVHGDLEIFNLVLDQEMNIVSVLDWEWSRVVPVQFFYPPLWLSSTSFESLCYGYQYNKYIDRFDGFLAILRARERQKYGNELLADEWDNRKPKGGFVVAHALECWTGMDWFANRYINFRVHGGKEDLPAQVKAFIKSDPSRKALAKQKALDGASYNVELEEMERTATSHPEEQIVAISHPTGRKEFAFRNGQRCFQWLCDTLIWSPARHCPSAYAVGGACILLAVASSYIIGTRGMRWPFSRWATPLTPTIRWNP